MSLDFKTNLIEGEGNEGVRNFNSKFCAVAI